eukprot:PhF_6_TR39005/c0_g1_i4/m.58379
MYLRRKEIENRRFSQRLKTTTLASSSLRTLHSLSSCRPPTLCRTIKMRTRMTSSFWSWGLIIIIIVILMAKCPPHNNTVPTMQSPSLVVFQSEKKRGGYLK